MPSEEALEFRKVGDLQEEALEFRKVGDLQEMCYPRKTQN